MDSGRILTGSRSKPTGKCLSLGSHIRTKASPPRKREKGKLPREKLLLFGGKKKKLKGPLGWDLKKSSFSEGALLLLGTKEEGTGLFQFESSTKREIPTAFSITEGWGAGLRVRRVQSPLKKAQRMGKEDQSPSAVI